MYTHASTNPRRLLAASLALAAGLSALPGCDSVRRITSDAPASQERTPPKPQEASSTMAQPSPVASEAAKGPATLPEGRAQAFALDINQTTVGGNWDLQATVTGVDERAVTFRTERGESGRLLYRLPEGLRVPLREGQLVAIRRESRGFEASLGYELSVASEGQTVLASGRLFGESPLEARVSGDTSLRQVDERKTVLSESRFETIYQVPVVLTGGGQGASPSIGKASELRAGGRGVTVLVTSSTLTVPAPGQEGVAEGRGYALEYVVTAAGEPQPGASPSPQTTAPPTAQPAASPGVRP